MSPSEPHPEDLASTFLRVAHALKRTAEARLQEGGWPMSLARLKVLYHLCEGGPRRIGELSACIDVAARTMTSTVDGLEHEGLVRRVPDPGDRRATVVEATEAGRRTFERCWAQHTNAIGELLGVLDDDERLQLMAILRRLETVTETSPTAVPEPADRAG